MNRLCRGGSPLLALGLGLWVPLRNCGSSALALAAALAGALSLPSCSDLVNSPHPPAQVNALLLDFPEVHAALESRSLLSLCRNCGFLEVRGFFLKRSCRLSCQSFGPLASRNCGFLEVRGFFLKLVATTRLQNAEACWPWPPQLRRGPVLAHPLEPKQKRLRRVPPHLSPVSCRPMVTSVAKCWLLAAGCGLAN